MRSVISGILSGCSDLAGRRCSFRAPCGLFHTPAAVESCRKTAKKCENGLRISQTAYHAVCFSTRFSTGCGKVLPSRVGNGKENVGLHRGACPALPPAYPAFSLFSCPLSPTPFPGGEGGDQGYFMQGASPLASPGLNPGGTGAGGVSRAGGEACPGVARSTCRRCLRLGGLPSLPPAYSAFSFLLYPLSPRPPSPAGKGETQSLFRRGLRPRHPGIKPLAALTEPAKQVPSGGELARRCRLPPPPSPEERRAPTFFFPCLDRRGGL